MESNEKRYLPRGEWRFWGDFEIHRDGLPCVGMAVLTDTYFGWRRCVFPPFYPFTLVRWFNSIELRTIESVEVKAQEVGGALTIGCRIDDAKVKLFSYNTLFPNQWVAAWRAAGFEVRGAETVDTTTWHGFWHIYWWAVLGVCIAGGAILASVVSELVWNVEGRRRAVVAYLVVCYFLFSTYSLVRIARASKRREE